MSTATNIPLSIPGLDEPLRLQVHDSRDQVISQRLRETGSWEPFETSLLLDLLQPGDVFVDVGANLGYFLSLIHISEPTRPILVSRMPSSA